MSCVCVLPPQLYLACTGRRLVLWHLTWVGLSACAECQLHRSAVLTAPLLDRAAGLKTRTSWQSAASLRHHTYARLCCPPTNPVSAPTHSEICCRIKPNPLNFLCHKPIFLLLLLSDFTNHLLIQLKTKQNKTTKKRKWFQSLAPVWVMLHQNPISTSAEPFHRGHHVGWPLTLGFVGGVMILWGLDLNFSCDVNHLQPTLCGHSFGL